MDQEACTDTRKLALDYMLRALEQLDNDAGLSPIIGLQLQLAIDRLIGATKPATARQ